jgi:cell shape-determining protein MreC
MKGIVPQTVSDDEWEQLRKAYKEKQDRAKDIERLEQEEKKLRDGGMKIGK